MRFLMLVIMIVVARLEHYLQPSVVGLFLCRLSFFSLLRELLRRLIFVSNCF